MRFVPTRAHGLLDYVVGVVLILAPSILKLNIASAEAWVPILLGIAAITSSLLTDYEYGVVKFVPMRAHLMFDLITGVVLVASPWLFGFVHTVWMPHVILGLIACVAALVTRAEPELAPALRSRRAS